jgi:hypothetical protein
MVQEHRNKAISEMILVIYNHITTYFTPDIICGHSDSDQFACDANVLGSLLKSSATIGIWPRPKVPYHGITFSSLASKIREMKVLDTCKRRDSFHYQRRHGIGDAIEASIKSLENQFCGLKLDSFLLEKQSIRKEKDKESSYLGTVCTNNYVFSLQYIGRALGR